MTELKPCPFCGGEAFSDAFGDTNYVECDTCFARGPTKESEAEAIEAWNSRHGDNREVTP